VALASGSADGSVRLWGLPARAARLGQTPVERMTFGDWAWVRARLAEEGVAAAERQALRFLDRLLRLRWRAEVHVEEAGPRPWPGEYDVALE
jgi:hypothetical protein